MQVYNKMPWRAPQGWVREYFRHYPVSFIMGLTCVVLYLGFRLDPHTGSLEAFARWGVPSTDSIRDGHLWGLVTNNFLNSNLLLVCLALTWFWDVGGFGGLGRFLEERVSRSFYIWLV